MTTVWKAVAGVVAGSLVSFLLVIAVELFGAVAHPVPKDFGNTMQEMCRHVERFPNWVLAVCVPLWAVTAVAGTWTAHRIGNLYSAVIVGLLLFASVAFNVAMLPYPVWFKVACLIAIPIAVVVPIRRRLRRETPAPSEGH
jgi:hypothetical protein